MITVDDLTVRYGRFAAATGVRLNAAPGTTIGLVGTNGSGKSTVLRAILGAVKHAGGTVAIDADDIADLSAREMSRRLAAVAQDETSGLPLTAWDCVLLGRSVHLSGWSSYRDADRTATEQAMLQTGVQHLASRQLSELSGGERQRVLIARALAQAATHLLLDEPTNHLDVRFQHEILSLVAALPLCTIVVLHDLNLAGRYCDELVLLSSGHVVVTGTPDEVLRPNILEPVYQIDIRRIDFDGVPQLAFAPRMAPRSAI